jgi:arylsulfatase A-like enzyme
MARVASRRLQAASVGLALTLAFGCRPVPEPEGLQGVILVLLDTVRADRLGCYGYGRNTSPHIDALAGEGALFSQAVSPSPWTLPSVASLLAGQYPERVYRDKLTASLVETLQSAGIETVAITEGGFVSSYFDFDRGFDRWTEEEGAVQLVRAGQQRDPSKRGGVERTFSSVEDWLSERGSERFFLFVHTYEPHTPYTNHDFTEGLDQGRIGPEFTIPEVAAVMQRQLVLTEAETEYVGALYDGGIKNADRYVGQLRSKLAELGLSRSVALIVTSDHGEELGRHYPHNTGDHGHALLDTMVRVPLILHDPTADHSPRVVDHQVRLADVMPTVADLLDVPVDRPIDGRSVLPMISGEENDDRLALVGQAKNGPVRVGLRSIGFKYIKSVPHAGPREALFPEPPAIQLYDLSADPGELNNLAELRPGMVAELDRMLLERHPAVNMLVSPELAGELDPLLLERLKSLGYLN